MERALCFSLQHIWILKFYLFLNSNMYKLQLSLTPSDIFTVFFGFAWKRDIIYIKLFWWCTMTFLLYLLLLIFHSYVWIFLCLNFLDPLLWPEGSYELGSVLLSFCPSIFPLFLHKSHTWEKSTSWDIGQNALNQSGCSIFKLTISLEQNDEKAWFFACWCRFIEIKSQLKNIGMGMVKNGCGYYGLRTLKLAVSLEGINRVSWFLVCG